MSARSRKTIIAGFSEILHGGDYNPDQWQHLPEILEEDRRFMDLAGVNLLSVGIFAWAKTEPREGVFEFDWLDRTLEDLAAGGHKAFLATPSGAKPAWMARKYPEIRRVDARGRRDEQEGRHNHCWTSPIYREKVLEMNTRLAERYGEHPAVGGWHLSNEYSGHCHCDLCLAKFREWLRERYGSLDALNEAWWTAFWAHTYTDWEEIVAIDSSTDALWLDWMRFLTWQCGDFIDWESKPLKQITPHLPRTTNYMGTFDGLNYAELAKHLDFVSDDQYPGFWPEDPSFERNFLGVSFKQELMRGFKPDVPWMLMESCPGTTQWRTPRPIKRPGVHRLEMLQAIAHGAEGTCYFQWRAGRGACERFHGAVVDHSRSPETTVFKDVAALSQTYARIKDVIGKDIPDTDVAFIYDWEAKWALSAAGGVKSEDAHYDRTQHDFYRAFWESGRAVDIRDQDADLSAYRVVVTPLLFMLKPGVGSKLRAFVEQGGTLIASHNCFMVDSTIRTFLGGWPGEGLREVFGIWQEDLDWLPKGSTIPVTMDGHTLAARDQAAALHLEGARAVATYGEGYLAGRPAITENAFGRGRAIYIGADLAEADLADALRSLLPELAESRLPSGLFRQSRGTDEAFVFATNLVKQPVEVPLNGIYQDADSGDRFEGSAPVAPLQSRVLRRI